MTFVQIPLAPMTFEECKSESEKWGLLMLDTSKERTKSEIHPAFLKDENMASDRQRSRGEHE